MSKTRESTTRRFGLLTGILLCLGAPSAQAQDSLMTPRVKRAVERGLDALTKAMHSDGTLAASLGDPEAHVGVTALAGLAFLAGGHTPDRGSRGAVVGRLLDATLRLCDSKSGLIVSGRSLAQPLYSHAFATLFLAQAWGSCERPGLGAALKRATRLILASQNESGGWRYTSGASDADLSVTACQLAALKSARRCGISVPAITIERARAYILSCRNPNGSFRYQRDWGQSSMQLTAAALVSLHQSGPVPEEITRQGLAHLDPYYRDKNPRRIFGYPFYGHYYALQAAWYGNQGQFPRWYRSARDQILDLQLPNGSFKGSAIGELYANSMALIVLQLPNHFLPILIR